MNRTPSALPWPAVTPQSDIGPLLAIVLGVTLPSLMAVGIILAGTGGEFAYPMDGPYIHMAMADQISHGHYGLNPGEPASPSSTILYPFLLALLPSGVATSLIVCLTANASSAALLYAIAIECGIRLRAVAPGYLLAIAVALALGLNLVGLALGGLEHAPQVAFSLAALLGVVRFGHRGRADAWWLAALVVLPLLRFETMTVTLACVLVMLAKRQWRPALAVLGLLALVVAGFVVTMTALGLPWLPQSVVDRSMVAGDSVHTDWRKLPGKLVWTLYTNLRINLLSHGGTHVLLGMLVLWWGMVARLLGRGLAIWRRRRGGFGSWFATFLASLDGQDQARIAATLVFAFAGLAHVIAGSFASSSRYEIYLLALGIGAMLVVFDRPLTELFDRMGLLTCALICASFLVGGGNYVLRSIDAVKAAQALHWTDDQIARFVTEYWRGPVIVTRYGRINWRNPFPVAVMPDFPRTVPKPVQVMGVEAATTRHGVGLAMLYDGGSAVVPPKWRPIAWLGARSGSAPGQNYGVTFYAVRPEDVLRIEAALHDFAPTLPAGTVLEMPPMRP